MVRKIGVRELRQYASEHLKAVIGGADVIVTDRGVPVARLVPLSPLESQLAELVRIHGLTSPARPRRQFTTTARLAGPPLTPLVDEGRAEPEVLHA